MVNGDETLSVQSSEGVRTSSGQILFSQYTLFILHKQFQTITKPFEVIAYGPKQMLHSSLNFNSKLTPL